jgi:uncharacterized protein
MTRIRRLALALLLAVSCSAAAFAQQAQGDWNGALNIPPDRVRIIGVHVEQVGGGLSGAIFSPDNNSGPGALADVALSNGVLTFKAPATNASFEGRWDEAKKAWVGAYTTPNGKFPLTLAAGKAPPVGPLPAVAGLDGRWEGKLEGVTPIIVRLKTDIDGTVAQMDRPSANSVGLPMRSFTRDGRQVRFTVPSLGIVYEGELSPAGDRITGVFAASGQQLPFELKRVSADASPTVIKPRPQTPQKPYPYREEEMRVENTAGGLTLPCTLTLPEGAGKHPAALLLSGSGPQDRDETMAGHKPFLVLADHLTRKGIAVLRCDDRDVVRPLKDPREMGSLVTDLMTDAQAAIALLRARPDIDPARVGVIGHSEGGITGPRLAAADPKIAFVVMLAGPGVRGRDMLAEQRARLVEAMGAPPQAVAFMRTSFGQVFDQMLAAPNDAEAKAIVAKFIASLPTGDGKPMPQEVIDQAAAQLGSAYYLDILRYDPAPVFAKIKAPILAINGTKDVQVEARQNLGGLKTLTAGLRDVTLVELPGLNHLFQTATTGAITEYADIDETFAPAALEAVSGWLVQRMKP